MRGKSGPPLLIIFGLGIGLALSVFVRGLPVGGSFGAGGGNVAGGGDGQQVTTVTVAKDIKHEALTSGTSADDGTSYKTGAIAPKADQLVVAAVANEVVGKDAHPTLEGNGLKWVEVASESDGKHRVSLLRAMGKATSGPLTIKYTEQQHNSAWSLSQFSGVDTGGSDGSAAVAQSSTGKATGSEKLEVSLKTFAGKNNVAYGAFAGGDAGAEPTAGTDFEKIHAQAVEAISEFTEWASKQTTKVDVSVKSGVDWAGVGIEIKAGSRRVQRVLASAGRAGTNGTGTQGQTIAGSAGTSGTSGGTSQTDPSCRTNCGASPPPTDASSQTYGVTPTEIHVAANIVTDGTGGSFLKNAIDGMRAAFNEANVHGVNGRKILLDPHNDSWSAETGLSYIQNYIASKKYFALAVNPSSEGLNLAVQNNTIDNAGIPVVGTDGMLISQYRWPANSSNPGAAKWVWPVAASTVSTMHIIGEYGKNHYNAQTFGLVYDKRYKFGVEGEAAFRNHLASLGVASDNVYTLGIEPGQTSYNTDAQTFNRKCGTDANPKCDLVAMLLDPATAITWIGSGASFGKKITNGPQTLFNRSFAKECVTKRKSIGQSCHDFVVWTGYNPPVPGYDDKPGVAKYAQAVHAVNGQADVQNSFTEGAYLGAKVFVEAIKRTGRDLTREKLRTTLDSMTYQSDLSQPLTWTPGSHFANTYMHAFRISYTPAGFQDWGDENTGWVKDSRVGQY